MIATKEKGLSPLKLGTKTEENLVSGGSFIRLLLYNTSTNDGTAFLNGATFVEV